MADGVVIHYGDLLSKISCAALWLRHQSAFQSEGVPRVGLACPSGIDYIILALAILKAGGCLVPIAEELTAEEREDLISRTGLSGVVLGPGETWHSEQIGERDPASGAAWFSLEKKNFDHESEFSALNPAFIRFSSGTTGRSKGVVISHTKLRERIVAANAALAIGPDDRVLWMLPMAHHFAVSIILYLYHGACTVIGKSHLAEEVLTTARECRATVMYGAPFHYALLAADRSHDDWPDLRLAVSTAAPLPADVARKFASRFHKPLVQGLGIIEIGLPLLNTDGACEVPDSVGKPLPAFDVELRDDEGSVVTAETIGELWIKGPGMFDAYLSPWQRVDEVCVDGWFSTGDLAEADTAGRIFIRGRKRSVINVSGMKVFPEEIEAVLLQHPAIAACRVHGTKHPMLGMIPVAEIVLREEFAPLPRELAEWCRERLSAYKVPARFSCVAQLELTASGKIRRH